MTTAVAEQRYLTIGQAARYLTISPTALRRLLDAGALSALRPTPRRVILDRMELDEYAAATRRQPEARGESEKAS